MVVLTIATLPMLSDYVTVLLNVRGSDLFYLVSGFPLMVVGWLAR